MKKIIIVNLFVLSFLASLIAQELLIFHTNDHHGQPYKYQWNEYEVAGLAERMNIIREWQKGHKNVLILDAGDFNTGIHESRAREAEPDLVGYNNIKYDALALGNHEFYGTLDRLQRQAKIAQFPFLAANVHYINGKEPFRASIIKRMPNGLRVAIFGLTTSTLLSTNPELAETILIEDEIQTAKKMVAELRKKADIIIALVHLGFYFDEQGELQEKGSVKLAREVSGINLIIDGHAHAVLDKPLLINQIPIVTAGEGGKYLGIALLNYNKKGKNVRLTSWESIPMYRQFNDPEFFADPDLTQELEKFKDTRMVYSEVLGYFEQDYSQDQIRIQRTPLGTLIADAYLYAARDYQPDLAFTNAGGIRKSLYQGEIRDLNLVDVLPFDNELSMMEVSGEILAEMIDFSFAMMIGSGGFLQYSSNVTITAEPQKILVNNQELVRERLYRVVTNSYLANGGDNYHRFLKAPHEHFLIATKECKALIEFIRDHNNSR